MKAHWRLAMVKWHSAFPGVTVCRTHLVGMGLLLASLLGCGAVQTQRPTTLTLWDQQASLRSQVGDYERRGNDWNTRSQALTQEVQIISAHPALPKISRAIQEEKARALVKGQEPDLVGAITKLSPSVEEVQLVLKLVSLSEQAEALQQEGQSLEAERQRLQLTQNVLGVRAKLQQEMEMEQERANQQYQAAVLYWLMNRR
jgi:hypothetical protein